MIFGLYQYLHSTLSFLGVVLNIFLLFLALTKSPKIMRPCSALITNKALTDILSSLASFFVMQRIFTDGESVTIIPTGPCTHFGPVSCYAGHMFMMSFLEHNMIWLIACYLFRYYILYVRDPSIKSIIFAAFSVYTPSLIHMAIWIKMYAAELLTTTQGLAPMNSSVVDVLNGADSNTNDMIITGNVVYWSSIVVFTQLVVTAVIVVCAYLWIRNVLINFILSMGAVMNKDVKVLNKQLVKILTFQVCIPIWIFLGVIGFLAMYYRTVNSQFVQYAITVSFMLAPVMSPFSYILFVPTYWNFCTRKEMKTANGTSVCTSTNCQSTTNGRMSTSASTRSIIKA